MHVLGPQQLLMTGTTRQPTNGRFHTLLENTHVGLICLVPGRRETLRINGPEPITDLPERDSLRVLASDRGPALVEIALAL